MTKKRKLIILGMSIIVVIIIIVIILILINKKTYIFANDKEGAKFRDEYTSLNNKIVEGDKEYPKVDIPSDNNIKYITIDETLKILEDGDAAIYIGYAECLYCRSAVEVLVDTANKSKLENVYYLDISDIWDTKEVNDQGEVITTKEANDKYSKLLGELGDERLENYILTDKSGNNVDTKTKRVKVPLVIFVVNGDIVSYWSGTVFSQKDPYTKLNEDQIKGLSEIYSYGLQDVVNAINNESRIN